MFRVTRKTCATHSMGTDRPSAFCSQVSQSLVIRGNITPSAACTQTKHHAIAGHLGQIDQLDQLMTIVGTECTTGQPVQHILVHLAINQLRTTKRHCLCSRIDSNDTMLIDRLITVTTDVTNCNQSSACLRCVSTAWLYMPLPQIGCRM
jgi:hypothetical protein